MGANAEAISDLQAKLDAASAEVERLQHIEGKPCNEGLASLEHLTAMHFALKSFHRIYGGNILLIAVLASDALDALEAQTQESARLKARVEELETASTSNDRKPSETPMEVPSTNHSSEEQVRSRSSSSLRFQLNLASTKDNHEALSKC